MVVMNRNLNHNL